MHHQPTIEQKFIDSIKNSNIAQNHVMKSLAGDDEYIQAVSTYKEFLFKIDYNKTITEAFLFALEKHEGQYYVWKKGRKLPYTYHLCKCALNTATLSYEDKTIVIALWHDLLEDERATKKDLTNQIKKSYFDANEIINALILLDKGNSSSSKEYFSNILQNKDASLIKTADLIANLDECIDRFDEMIGNEQRFWIYDYLIEIPQFFLNSKHLPRTYNKIISSKISKLHSLLSDKNQKEFKRYSREVKMHG
ncbi:MAG: hypothetical protein Q8Q01_01765 [archaeon]|nr:hypothetical protein [archaeon]